MPLLFNVLSFLLSGFFGSALVTWLFQRRMEVNERKRVHKRLEMNLRVISKYYEYNRLQSKSAKETVINLIDDNINCLFNLESFSDDLMMALLSQKENLANNGSDNERNERTNSLFKEFVPQ